MKVLRDSWTYARFLGGLPAFLREEMTLDRAREIVRERMRRRGEGFLRLVERSIYGYPRSPYRNLLGIAGCELGDLRRMVGTDGLEASLKTLREAGVYVTFEEFKGRVPLVRAGQEIPVLPEDFDNPHLSRSFGRTTGGSTGGGRHVRIDLDHLRAQVAMQRIINDTHGFDDLPTANWYDSLPGPGMVINLLGVPCKAVPDRWFSPILSGASRPPLRFRLTERGILTAARLTGTRLPKPESANLDEPQILARWAADALREHGRCRIIAMVSRALRIALTAEEMGLDLSGAVFSVGGEPLTEAKARAITRTGARLVPTYFFAEAGAIGYGCARPKGHNDIHFFADHLALIQHAREVPGFARTVDSFHFTTLLPLAPKVLLNAESDDYGIVEDRACGCGFEEVGLTTHFGDIRSFQKLTGEGVTLIGSDMVRILEEVLPARFGGSPLDYQLLEEEDENGLTRLSLLISPRIELEDEDLVIHAVLAELGRGDAAADISRAIWSQAGTFRVRRMEPVWTARGKLLPLHMVKRGGPST